MNRRVTLILLALVATLSLGRCASAKGEMSIVLTDTDSKQLLCKALDVSGDLPSDAVGSNTGSDNAEKNANSKRDYGTLTITYVPAAADPITDWVKSRKPRNVTAQFSNSAGTPLYSLVVTEALPTKLVDGKDDKSKQATRVLAVTYRMLEKLRGK